MFTPLRRRRAINLAATLLLVLGPAGVHARDTEDASGHGLVRTLLALLIELVRKTSGFAMRRHPVRKTAHFHKGVDFAAPHGTPVRSVRAGRVAFAGTQDGYGNVVYITHDGGAHDGGDRTTVYAHLSRIEVRVGDPVDAGQTIGAVGNTGLSTGSHLHFEVHEGGRPIDPIRWAHASLREAGIVHAGLTTAAIGPTTLGNLDTSIDAARCLDLLQKFSLEALAPEELDLLRRGCSE